MTPAKLEKIPGFSQGVRVNAAQRMIKLNRPICPNSNIVMEWDRNGKPVAKDLGPEIQNCQMSEDQGPWWEGCEAKGHDPYFTTRKWETKEDILEPELKDGKATGRLLKTGEAIIPHEARVPNLAQVAVNVRINNGRGAVDAVGRKGFRRLRDAGYEEVCEFRNCQKSVVKNAISRQYGSYCSKEHLQLIAADAESIMLTQGAVLPVDSKRAQQKRAHQLREISIGTVD
jgi:hypothetical protein